MSASPQSPTSELAPGEALQHAEGEEVDALPVLEPDGGAIRVRRVTRALAGRRGAPAAMAVQAAAAAAGGFMAGAVVVRFAHRRRLVAAAGSKRRRVQRKPARRGGRGAGASELVQIVGSRSLLLDVHLLAGPGKDL